MSEPNEPTGGINSPPMTREKWPEMRMKHLELMQGVVARKGLLGITMEDMKQRDGFLDRWTQYNAYGPFKQPNNSAPIYSWVHQNGRQNVSGWIETAAKAVGR